MKTYLFKDGSHYKIGRSLNIKERFNTIRAFNPTLEVVTFVDKNIESKLHQKYKNNRDVYEWFLFSDKEIQNIIEFDFDNPNIFEIDFLDYKISTGQYAGRFLVTMFSDEEINYLKVSKNKYYDFWVSNYLRYSFIKKDLIDYNKIENKIKEPIRYDDIVKVISLVNDLHLNRDLFFKNKEIIGTKKILECFIELGNILNLKTIPDYAKENNMSYNGVKNNRKIIELFNVKFVIDND